MKICTDKNGSKPNKSFEKKNHSEMGETKSVASKPKLDFTITPVRIKLNKYNHKFPVDGMF